MVKTIMSSLGILTGNKNENNIRKSEKEETKGNK